MSAETVADRRLHPGTVPLRFLKDAPSTALGLPAVAGFMSDIGIGRVLIGVAVLSTIVLLFSYLGWRSFRYGVGQRDIVIERGILTRSRRSIPFDRIQDVDIERGPLARLFGLAKLRIETGGAGTDEGALDSVSVAEAERLRAALRARHAETGPVALEKDVAGRTIFAMAPPRVLLSGLFNFSLLWIAGLFAALQTMGDLLPFDSWGWVASTGLTEGRVSSRVTDRFTPAMIAAVLALAALLGIATGIVRTLARDWAFRLTVEPEGLRRQRGLITRTEIMIPKRRVQLGLIETGLIRRWLGWLDLSFQTLSMEKETKGKQSVAPFARMDELTPILAEAAPLYVPPPEALTRVSRNYVWKAVLGRLPLALGAVAVVIALPLVWPLLAVIPLLVLGAILERGAHAYALIDDMLFVKRGFLSQKLWLVPVRNAQTISVSSSWLQRRFDIATLLVDTAGASMLSDPRIVGLRRADAAELADALAAKTRA